MVPLQGTGLFFIRFCLPGGNDLLALRVPLDYGSSFIYQSTLPLMERIDFQRDIQECL